MGSYYQKFDVKIGIVCDAILYEALSPAADFVYISPCEGWQRQVDGLDLLLVVSTWRGLRDDEWDGLGRVEEPIRQRLLEIIAECNRRGIKTVFYSKEDPPNYNVFLDFAKSCDYVFTSAAEMVPRYKADCGHERVAVLRFCINPDHDNPIGCLDGQQVPGAIFSGSWMVKYPVRCRDLAVILDGALAAGRGLCIVDRNSYRKGHPGYCFPKRFQKYIIPAVPHDRLSAMHKKYRWSINVNSVTDSSTMFAARCYELLANGCLVVSNFSTGMLKALPEVAIADGAKFAARLIRAIKPEDAGVLRSAGIRRVMSGNTCYERVAKILKTAGFAAEIEHPTVAVVLPKNDERLCEMFKAQSYAKKRLYTADSFDGKAKSECEYVAYWEAGQVYGEFFLQDLLDVFKYTDADFAVDEGVPYSYVDCPVQGRSLFRAGGEMRTGFCISRSDASEKDVRAVCEGVHEITRHLGRKAEDFKPPLLTRALACFHDNGFIYTMRRVFFGRQY